MLLWDAHFQVDNYIYYFDGNKVGVVDNHIIPISGLDAGNYTLTVTTIADADHNSVTKKVNVTVLKVDSALNIDDINIVYGESINYVAAADGATGVAAEIDGEDIDVIDVYAIVIPSLDAGSYALTVMAIPDNTHKAISKTVNITVGKADSVLTIEKINFDESFIVVSANGAIGVTARIDGVDVAVVDNYTIVIPSLEAGNHILSIATLPDANHNSVSRVINLEVSKRDSTLIIDNVNMDYGESINVVVKTEGCCWRYCQD